MLVTQRSRAHEKPSILPVRVPYSMLAVKRDILLERGAPRGTRSFAIVRMQHLRPAESFGFGRRLSRILVPAVVAPRPRPVWTALPEEIGHDVRHCAETRIAPPQCRFGPLERGDVDECDHDALDPVFHRAVGGQAHDVPTAVLLALHLAL